MLIKSTQITKAFATAFLVIYSLWALFNIGVIGFLMTASIGLISFGVLGRIELASAFTIVLGIVVSMALKAYKSYMKEGFEANSMAVILPGGPQYKVNASGHESAGTYAQPGAPVQDSLVDIAKRIAKIQHGPEPTEVKGFSSSSFVEGFADADSVAKPVPDAGSGAEQKEKASVESPSKPAPIEEATKVNEQMKKDLPKEEFKSQDDGLFRLGQLPTDTKDGPHIDAATTMMNALNALKPKQIEAMTNDTQKLLETQKSLMSMLETMKPMLQDGKQLIDQFGGMFGKQQ